MHPQRQIHLGLGEPLLADHLDDIGLISLAPNLARDDLDDFVAVVAIGCLHITV